MDIAVPDTEKAVAEVSDRVSKAGGYVAQSTLEGDTSDGAAELVVRVPRQNVLALRQDIRALGRVTQESEKVEDVTAPRADLDARLHAARVHERRLLELLEKRTGSLAEVVAVEQALSVARAQIEQMEAQDRALRNQVELATLTLSIRAEPSSAWPQPLASVKTAWTGGLRVCALVLVGILVAMTASAPTLMSLGALVLLVAVPLRWMKRRRRRTLQPNPR
jgi:hypothetical protein